MTAIETIIYKCDHCGKKQLRKGDMTKHEKWCKKNPANMHKCFQWCKHLIQDREAIGGTGDYDTPPTSRRTFQCAVTKKFMYSFHAERRKLVDNLDKSVERMPLECDLYEDRMYENTLVHKVYDKEEWFLPM